MPNFGTWEEGEVMKERFNKAREWIKAHKKRSTGIAIAMFLLIGAVGIGIGSINTVNASKTEENNRKVTETAKNSSKKNVKDGSSTKKKDTDSDKKKNEKDEVKTEEKDTTSDQEKKAEDTKQAVNSDAATTGSTNAGVSDYAGSSNSSGSGNSQKQSHTHNYATPVYGTEQKWVVDQAAWTETVNEPIYENKLVWYCNTCGADITADPEGHVDATMHGGYRSDYIPVQTGTNTYTIDHPEEGHWESYSVVTGYQCSCGAVK